MKQWIKEIPMNGDGVLRGVIEERVSEIRGMVYDISAYEYYSDGSKSAYLMTGWHDTLAGAKRIFDKDYGFDKNIKWRQLKY